MKKTYLIAALLFLFQLSYGQKLNRGIKCGFYDNKTIEERNKTAPFNSAKKVVLIAFPDNETGYIGIDYNSDTVIRDSLFYSKVNIKVVKTFSLPHKSRSDESYFLATEIVPLEQNQINELSHLMVNFKIAKWPKQPTFRSSLCYAPRNAVLFLGENDIVTGYLEICFQCSGQYLFPDTFNYNEINGIYPCGDEKLMLLKDFFKGNGIKYGIDYR